MKKFLIRTIILYQKIIGPNKRPNCVFVPTCSEYALEALEKYGAWKGSILSAKRIIRCHPFAKNRVDPLK
ncbi:MAG TPA: membrane protein insertion efficiency factor YidD [Candidatus Paceibacterota bacterium]|jgi:putative membrane protein insertion efficiency factor|nr:membrane protein insertion efficiency factor YidD [Candidatus Paceibacterota bacterium]